MARGKLQEARGLLDDMRRQELKAFGDKSRFNYYLSAFLNAGRTVDYRLRHEYAASYPAWREKWNTQHPSEDHLVKFIHEKRRLEVHERGAGHVSRSEQIKIGVGGSYSDESGTLQVMGSPSPLMGTNVGATISKTRYFFDVDGTERSVTEVCTEYLSVLERMVADFEAAVAGSPPEKS
jgi:hypothetical protein